MIDRPASLATHPRSKAGLRTPVVGPPVAVYARVGYIGRVMYRSASETLGFIKPELPTLVPEPPAGEGWIHEINDEAI